MKVVKSSKLKLSVSAAAILVGAVVLSSEVNAAGPGTGQSAWDTKYADFPVSAVKVDDAIVNISLGAPMVITYDFSSQKFITTQGQSLRVFTHTPSTVTPDGQQTPVDGDNFGSFSMNISSVVNDLTSLTGTQVPYTLHLSDDIASANKFNIPKATDSAPFIDPASKIATAAEFTRAGLGNFNQLVGGGSFAAHQNIEDSTLISLVSEAAPNIADGVYSDSVRLYVKGTWANITM